MRIGKIVSTILLLTALAFSQANVGGRAIASQYGQWKARLTADVAAASGQVATSDNCYVVVSGGRTIFPYSTVIPLTIDNGSNAETVTPTAVTTPIQAPGSPQGYTCTFTATFSNAHKAGSQIVSGDGGIGEAVADLKAGNLVLDPQFSSDTAIASIPSGTAAVALEDIRSGAPVHYVWNGTAYKAVGQAMASTNGGSLVPFYNEELITLATGATTTDSTANLLPANSIILAGGGRVQTTITGSCTGWEIGDATTVARFTINDTTLTANETKINTGTFDALNINSATTGVYQAAAAKVRITCAGGNPSAGKIRVFIAGFTATAPTL